MTTEYLLQACLPHNNLRRQVWPLARRLFGSLDDLQRAAAFVQRTGVSILSDRQEEEAGHDRPLAYQCTTMQRFIAKILAFLTLDAVTEVEAVSYTHLTLPTTILV